MARAQRRWMLPSYRDAVLATGPVGYWRLGEAAGTVARDVMGANHGTYVNAPTLGVAGLLAGDSDKAVTLNGTTHHVTTALTPADTFTLLAVIKRTATGRDDWIASRGDAGLGFEISGADRLVLLKEAVGNIAVSTVTVDTGTHTVAVTKSGPAVHLYLDGQDVTGSVSNQTPGGIYGLKWGGSTTYGIYFLGTLDEPAHWDRALSADEIAGLWRVGMGR